MAADPVSYAVRIEAPAPLAELLEKNLDLVRWRGNPRLDNAQLQRLVKAAPEQVRTLVATEGYYAPTVTAGMGTEDGAPVVRVTVEPGAPVRVGAVDLVLQGFHASDRDQGGYDPAALRNSWPLTEGKLFRQADWELAKRNLLRQVMQTRYPRAQLSETAATVDPDTLRAALRVVLDSGPEMRFGALRIEGLQRYPDSVVRNLNTIRPGDEYSEAALQAYQGKLQDTGYFSGVDVSADLGAVISEGVQELEARQADPDTPAPAASGPVTVPVVVRLTENKRKNASVGLGFSTNTGNRASLAYDDLRIFGLRLKSGITLETKRQGAHADFYFPTTERGYNDSVGAAFERNDINGEVTSVTTVAAKRAWGTPLLERSVQLEYLAEQKTVTGQPTSQSKSLPLTYSLTRRRLDSLLFPTKGYVLDAQLGGALLPVLTDELFVRARARFIAYRPLSAQSTLILRGEAGILASRDKAGVPATYLFRAGGDQSVRGYGYQQLGVEQGTAVVGGRYLLSGSAEYQYWFKPKWGAAVFYDAGNAGDIVRDLKPKSGYGVGARWRSPVGPINVDAAYGHAIKKFRLHFSLGFTF